LFLQILILLGIITSQNYLQILTLCKLFDDFWLSSEFFLSWIPIGTGILEGFP